MNHIILIHGAPEEEDFRDTTKPSPSKRNWFPWIQEELRLNGIDSDAPEMPKPYDPIYQEWVKVFEQYSVSNETTLIGHSCGGGFILRYLSEHPEVTPKRAMLVAPWLDPEPREFSTNFFDFEIDSTLTKRIDIHIFMSSNDPVGGALQSFEVVKKALPNATYHTFSDKEHFDTREYEKEFHELLEEILK